MAATEWDEIEFANLVAPYRRELHLHCYRMLGSVTYADDLLQETLLAAWQGIDRFAGASSLRTWLYRIATNRCLNAIRDGRRRPATVPLPPFDPPTPTSMGEVNWLQPYPDRWLDDTAMSMSADPAGRVVARETVGLAFVTALQRLAPRQAAAVILHDVLDFDDAEIAAMLDSSPTATKGLLQRGRSTLRRAHTDSPKNAAVSVAVMPAAEQALANRFAAAFAADDIKAIVDMLTDRSWLRMPPALHQYRGARAIGAFLDAGRISRNGRRFDLSATAVNRQPAYLCRIDSVPLAVLAIARTASGAHELVLFVDPAVAVRQASVCVGSGRLSK